MKTSIKFISVLGLLAFSMTAEAQWHHRCDYYSPVTSTPISKEILKITGPCTFHEPTLIRAPWQGITVDAWYGGYTRTVLTRTYYRIDYYDTCSGNWLWSRDQNVERNEDLSFDLDNPNLADDVKESYVAGAPRTDTEVRVQLLAKQLVCQNLQPGPIDP